MANSIHHKYFFSHPAELVWEFLTSSELMAQWLMKNDFQPIVGHDFQFLTKPMPAMDFDGVCYCKVLEVSPFNKLSYSWKGGPGDGTMTLDSVVVWTLHSKDNGTELVLDHTGFKEIENLAFYNSMNDGWQKILQKIAAMMDLQTGKVGNPAQ
jgi:uncharacterized protein YndB with AHSA1/START domain